MDSKIITLGEVPQQFILALEKDTGLPSWIAENDELWLNVVGQALYEAINNHQFLCINKCIEYKKDFAATMTIENFRGLFLAGEAKRFQDHVFALIDFTIKNIPNPSNKIYITFCSTSEASDHVVNCIIELDKGLIMFGGQLV